MTDTIAQEKYTNNIVSGPELNTMEKSVVENTAYVCPFCGIKATPHNYENLDHGLAYFEYDDPHGETCEIHNIPLENRGAWNNPPTPHISRLILDEEEIPVFTLDETLPTKTFKKNSMIKYKLAMEGSIREVVNSSNLWILHTEELASRKFTCPCCDIPAVVVNHKPGEKSAYFHYEEPHAKNCAIFLDLFTINSAYGQLVRMMRLMLEGISNGFEYYSIAVRVPDTGEYADSTEEGKLLFKEVCKLEYKGNPTHDIHEALKKAFATLNEMLVVHVPKDQIIDISVIQVQAGQGFDVEHAYGELLESIYVILTHISLALKSTNIRFSKINDGGSHDYYLTSIDAQYVAEEAKRVLLMCVEHNQFVSDSDKAKAYRIDEDVHESIMASLEEVLRVLDSSPPRDFSRNLTYVTRTEPEFEQDEA